MGRIFITGGSGLLGCHVATQAVECGWDTWATYSGHPVDIPSCRTVNIDIRNQSGLCRLVSDAQPDVILHSAAIAGIEDCEEDKGNAFKINVQGTCNIIAAAEQVRAHLIFISTGAVFNGERNPFKEDDSLSPVNYYGLTKASAEAAVYASCIDWAIVRTSVIYGPSGLPHRQSYSDAIISRLKAGEILDMPADRYRPAVPVWSLGEALLEIAERKLTGVYHAASPDTTSGYQFALGLADVFGMDRSLVKPSFKDTEESNIRSPKVLILDTARTSKILATRFPGFRQGIVELRKRMSK